MYAITEEDPQTVQQKGGSFHREQPVKRSTPDFDNDADADDKND